MMELPQFYYNLNCTCADYTQCKSVQDHRMSFRSSAYTRLYSAISENCDVHNLFCSITDVIKTSKPNLILIFDMIKKFAIQFNPTLNIWKSYVLYNQSHRGGNLIYKLCSKYCLLRQLNEWLETGIDFETASARNFSMIHGLAKLKYRHRTAAVLWDELDFHKEIETFLMLAPVKLLFNANCTCTVNNTDIIRFSKENPDFPLSYRADILYEIICSIPNINCYDFLEKIVTSSTQTQSKMSKIKYLINTKPVLNLFRFDEAMVKKILIFGIEKRVRVVSIDDSFNIKIPVSSSSNKCMIFFPDRCILCDQKPIKKLSFRQSEPNTICTYYQDEFSSRNRCYSCTNTKHDESINICQSCINIITSNQQINSPCGLRTGRTGRTTQLKISTCHFFYYRHYKIVLIYKAKTDGSSMFATLPAELIDLIVRQMSAYRYRIKD